MDIAEFYKGKTVLVTGGVGSIGSYLVRELLRYEPKSVRVFDNNETGLFDLEQDLQSGTIRLLVGDIRDKERLVVAMEGVDIVFHAAALKHVPLCEFNPYDAVKTNVLGTQNVLDAAYVQGVKKVITISTDKAVNPSNVMGATKLLAERLTISANNYHGTYSNKQKCFYSCVRFGNVLNSRGSIIPIFQNQIKNGGPIKVTHPDMSRFFMDIPSATQLILKAGMMSRGGEIFILKMPIIRIIDLADEMRRILAPMYGKKPEDITIDIIGMREGEKLNEELMTLDEVSVLYENQEMFVVVPKKIPYSEYNPYEQLPYGFNTAKKKRYSTKDGNILNNKEIAILLHNIGLSE